MKEYTTQYKNNTTRLHNRKHKIMTQTEKELLMKDISCRIPYGVIVNVNGISNVKLTSVSWYGEVGVDDGSTYLYPISEIKPYLFPMSSMTDAEKEEYCQLQQRVIYNSKGPVNEDVAKYINWCYKKHLDINNLIPMGLAIDATGLNIY